MRLLLILLMIGGGVVLLGMGLCSKPSEPVATRKPLKDFSLYLGLQPGATVRIVRFMGVSGGPAHVRDIIAKHADDSFVEGTVVSVDKETLTVFHGDGLGRVSYAPSAVKSIEVVESGK